MAQLVVFYLHHYYFWEKYSVCSTQDGNQLVDIQDSGRERILYDELADGKMADCCPKGPSLPRE
jgi:hypothetical protein